MCIATGCTRLYTHTHLGFSLLFVRKRVDRVKWNRGQQFKKDSPSVRGLYISLAIEMWFFIETGLVFRKENQTPSSSSSKPSEKTTDVHTLGAASRSWKSKKEQMDLCVHKYIWPTLEMEPETLGKTFNHQKMLNKRWTRSLGMWVSLSTHLKGIQEDVHGGGIHSIIQRLGRVIPVFSSLSLSQNQTLEQRQNGAASSLKRDFSCDSLTKMTRYP